MVITAKDIVLTPFTKEDETPYFKLITEPALRLNDQNQFKFHGKSPALMLASAEHVPVHAEVHQDAHGHLAQTHQRAAPRGVPEGGAEEAQQDPAVDRLHSVRQWYDCCLHL